MIHFGKELPALLRTQKQRESIQNKIPLSKKQSEIVAQLPKVLDRKEKKILEKLLGKQIVLKEELTKIPSSLEEARFCKSCAANDFIIPGLEFKDGLCPLCQTQDLKEALKSVLPLVQEIPKAKNQDSMSVYFIREGMQNYPSKMPRKDSRRVRFQKD
jgi:hypothetical protein